MTGSQEPADFGCCRTQKARASLRFYSSWPQRESRHASHVCALITEGRDSTYSESSNSKLLSIRARKSYIHDLRRHSAAPTILIFNCVNITAIQAGGRHVLWKFLFRLGRAKGASRITFSATGCLLCIYRIVEWMRESAEPGQGKRPGGGREDAKGKVSRRHE